MEHTNFDAIIGYLLFLHSPLSPIIYFVQLLRSVGRAEKEFYLTRFIKFNFIVMEVIILRHTQIIMSKKIF